MQDLVILLATICFLSAGLMVPFVLALGYVWVDIFGPHLISASLLTGQPVAFIMGAAAVTMYLVKDRKSPPKFTAITACQLLLCVWVTLTTMWAVAPDTSWMRLDQSLKVALFATFLPYAIRTRVQIEALLIVYLFSIAAHTVPWGVKTFLSGGGYDRSLGLGTTAGSLLQESSTVSAVCVMVIPLLLVLRKDSILLPKGKLREYGLLVLVILGPVAAIGTFARTALVAFAVTGSFMWVRSRRKVLSLVSTLILGGIAFSVTSDKWLARINTINDYQADTSANVRVLVWEWALKFLASHPFGGGFWVWVTNRIELPTTPGSAPMFQTARAFHNVFIALLAEHGYIGFLLYVGMLVATLVALQQAQKITRDLPEHTWCADLAKALQVSIITMYAAGLFVEIGWTPLIWYLISMAVCLREYARRVGAPKATLAEQHRLRIGGAAQSPAQSPTQPGPRPAMPTAPARPAFGAGMTTSFRPSNIREM